MCHRPDRSAPLQDAATLLACFLLAGFALVLNAVPASAATVGSRLLSPANESVCRFQSLEPATQSCTVGQKELLSGHIADGGLVAPFDGVIVGWSVISGTPLPGTGSVRLALRLMSGPGQLSKGPEVLLASSPAGTRHSFVERMPIGAGQPIGVKVIVQNGSTQEAGAPIAFREVGVGAVASWVGEPWDSTWESEEDIELLLDAVIEPDADRDGYGDITQDCFPTAFGNEELCGRDLEPPQIRARVANRQAFLRSGLIRVRLASSETGLASAEGMLEIKGRDGWTYGLRGARKSVQANGQASLLLRVRKAALKAARAASQEGKKIVVRVRLGVADAAGNERQATTRVRPSQRSSAR